MGGAVPSDGARAADVWTAAGFESGPVGPVPAPEDPAAGGPGCWERLDDPHADDWWVPDARAALAGVTVPTGDGRVVGEGVGADGEPSGSSPAWGSAECLERLAPGAGLAQVLELAEPALLADAGLVEAVVAAGRLAAWACLQAALLAAELSRRGSMNPDWGLPVPSRTCVAGDELAMRLGWSRPAAGRLVRDGRALEAELLPVADAVRAGLVDVVKLRVLTDRLAGRAYQLTWPVLEEVLPGAPLRTPTQLAADVDRALLRVDPADAGVRLPAAIAARHVCRPRRLPDGMAGIWAVLPAVDAARIDGTLEATSRAARAGGDRRTLDQLRADTLTSLATGSALLAAAAFASDGADHPCHEPDEPDEPDEPVGPPGGGPPGRRAPGIRIPRVRIDVSVALSTLLGMDEAPGELAGLGPIPAEQARALAAGGTWRRLVTDPLTGAVLDVGRTRYRPPRPIAEHVLARDQVCAAPGCSVPGHRCDLDHTTEYHATPANGSPTRGTTSAANLGPLSARCHRLKTDGGFTLTQTAPGTFAWHTPAGLTYRVTPGNHGHTERLGPQRDRPSAGYPDEPPF